jgi:hypothetical protein
MLVDKADTDLQKYLQHINIREMSLIFHINSNTTRTTDRLLSQSQRIFVSEN